LASSSGSSESNSDAVTSLSAIDAKKPLTDSIGNENSENNCSSESVSANVSEVSENVVTRTQSAVVVAPSLAVNQSDGDANMRRRKSTGDTTSQNRIVKNKNNSAGGNSKSRLQANNNSATSSGGSGVSPRRNNNNNSSNNPIGASNSDSSFLLANSSHSNNKAVSCVTVGVENARQTASQGQPGTTTIVANVMISIEEMNNSVRGEEMRRLDPIATAIADSNSTTTATTTAMNVPEFSLVPNSHECDLSSASHQLSEALREKEAWQRKYTQLEEERFAEKVLLEMQHQQHIQREQVEKESESRRLHEEKEQQQQQQQQEDLRRQKEEREAELKRENEVRIQIERELELRREKEDKERREKEEREKNEAAKARENLVLLQRTSEAEAKLAALASENARLERAAAEAEQQKREAETKSREAEERARAASLEAARLKAAVERARLDGLTTQSHNNNNKLTLSDAKIHSSNNRSNSDFTSQNIANRNPIEKASKSTTTASISTASPDELIFRIEGVNSHALNDEKNSSIEFKPAVFSPPTNVRVDERKLFALKPDIMFDSMFVFQFILLVRSLVYYFSIPVFFLFRAN
jgi:hypothetical protein